MSTRTIKRVLSSVQTMEGAGVHLRRAFGSPEAPLFDPFLLFDDFRSDTPEHYRKGFPWHPHRGIETITYVLKGDVEHGDSLGNKGDISSGDVQWMTAGSGIIHQEMPKGDGEGMMEGFQLWANLPASNKMMHPRYRDINADQVPVVTLDNGATIKVICGRIGDVCGPVKDVVIEPEYYDVQLPPNTTFSHPTKEKHTVFAYVHDGNGHFDEESVELLGNHSLVLYDQGEQVCVSAGSGGLSFLLIAGKPLGEPIAWRGPIVMNSQEELTLAFDEYKAGTFTKHD
jgi:redox-sensitive bicupin YhaK (pirin superfamily)